MPWLLLSLSVPRDRCRPGSLQQRIQAIIEGVQPASSGPARRADVAVGLTAHLDGSGELSIEPDKSFHAASTMKVPVMIELFRQAEAGLLKLDDPLAIKNEFHSIVDGSVYQLNVGDDSDAEVYKARRQDDVAARSVRSDDHGQQQLRGKPADRAARRGEHAARPSPPRRGPACVVLRGVEDQKAFDKGLNNATTARGAGGADAEARRRARPSARRPTRR